MQLKRLAIAASLALLAGCKSDKINTVTGFNGALSFTYSGSMSGTFNASGAFNQGTMETAQWAAGERDDAAGELFVGAAVPRGSTSHDYFGLFAERLTTGSVTINANTCTSNCGYIVFTLGQGNGTSSTFLLSCFFETGTIVITEISNTRARGTFSGTATCFPPAGSPESTMTVTNGSFDVALLSNID